MLAIQPAPAGAAGADAPIINGHFYTEAGGGMGLGFPIVDSAAGRFWSSFQALGGTAALGYPASLPYAADGFTYQAVQGALLQWRPDLGKAILANTFAQFTDAGLDSVLLQQRQIPLPIADDGSNGDYQQAVTVRLTWLTDLGIAQHFFANPNPALYKTWSRDDAIQRYGLPMSKPEAFGPFVSQRFQRITFQRWTQQVVGMPAPGTIVRVLGGDLAKEEGLVPEAAQTPQAMTGVTGLQVPPGVPADLQVPRGVPVPTPQPNVSTGGISGIRPAGGPSQFPLAPCRASAIDPNADQNAPGTPAPEAGQYLLYGNTPVKLEHFSNCWSPAQLQLMHNHRSVADISEVVIHWTDLDYARSVYALQRGVSVHWLVPLAPDPSQPALEMVDPRNAAWHAGPLNAGIWEDSAHLLCYPASPCHPNGNVHSLGFENVGNTMPNAYQVGVMTDIIATLIQEGYPIQLDRQHIVGHREINRQKPDPGNLDIDRVIALVRQKLSATTPAPVPLPVVTPATTPTPTPLPSASTPDGSSINPFMLAGNACGQLAGNSGGAFTYYTIAQPTGAAINLQFSYTGIAADAGAVGVSIFQGLTNLGTLSPRGGQSGATLTIVPQAGTPISVQVFSYVPQTVSWQLGAS